LTATNSDDVGVYVIVTMRLEWLNECSTYPGLADAINEGIYLVSQMQRRQLGQAILDPLDSADGTLTSALLDRMLNDLDNRTDQLPVLQHALLRLWALRHTKEPFDIADYEAVGTFSHCLSGHAQEVYDELTDRQKQLAELLFRNITQVNKNRKMRRPRPLGDIQKLGHVELAELAPVVLAFSKPGRSFLVTTQGKLTSESIVDISHEALIRQWTRLSEWVDSEAEIQARLLRLNEDATEWDRDRAHSRACLYTGTRLTRSQDLTTRLEPGSPASDFLQASSRAHFWALMRRRGIAVLAFASAAILAVALVVISREHTREAESARREAEVMAEGASRQAKQAQDYENFIKQRLAAANGSSTAIAAIVQDLNAKRIYIQYTPGQADAARIVQEKLQKNSFVVPALQQVSADKAPSSTQVRYFNADDRGEAASIVSMLRQWIPGTPSVQSSPNPKNSIPAGQFEVWLAPPPPSSLQPFTPSSAASVAETNPAPVAVPAPELTATPSTARVEKGHGFTLTWHSANATEVDIEGQGPVQLNGSMMMLPEQTMVFRLTAKNSGAQTAQVQIPVEVFEPAPAVTPAPAPVAPTPVPASDSGPAGDYAQIEAVLQRYKAAYETESVEEVKKVWPSIDTAHQKNLKNGAFTFTAVKLDLVPDRASVKITGDTATVKVRETRHFTQYGQVVPPMTETALYTLRKVNGRWVLASIQ
jgi:hypothetical protein